MDSIGGHDDEIQPSKINSIIERIDDKTQRIDSQSSPPSSTGVGNEGKGFNELDVLHSTLPFDDIIPHEAVFETQFLNFGGETQVLDDPEVVENIGTDYDNEIVFDTDGEETQVLGDTEELSDEDAIKQVGIYPVEDGQNLSIPTGKQDNQALRNESDSLNDKHHVSGSVPADFTSVRNAAFRASGLAAPSRASKGTNSESCSIKSAAQFTKLRAADEIEIDMIRDSSIVGEEVDDGDFPGLDDEQIKELRTKSNCRADCSTAGRLFTEDTLIESKEPNDSLNNADGNEISRLSYIDSQEPGELSQANAMAFVDRFIKFDVMDFDQEDGLGRSTGGKSEPVSCAKGTQSFVKRTNLEIAAGKRIFDWDDNLEDEGGGEFFIKKKEAFFDTEDRGNTSFPRKGSVISSSGLPLHNPKSSKTQNVNGKKLRKKLTKKLDELLNIGSSDGIEYTNTYKDVPEMLDVGVDTQIAAEAMETLCFGLDMVDPDSNDTDKGDKNMFARSCRGEKTKRSQSKKGGARKAPSSPSSGFISQNSKKTKRISSKSRKKSAVSSQKQAENLSKECGTNMIKEELNKSRSNGEGCFVTKQIKNTDKLSSADLKQLGEEQAQKRNDTGEVDRRHAFESSSGCMSVKKRRLEEEFSNSTPIARRTRQSKVQKFNDTTATFAMVALGYNRGKRTCRKLSSKSMRNGGLHASVNQSVVQGTNGQSPGNLKKGSLINALSTSVDVGNKRQASLDWQSNVSLFKHSIDKSSSGNATIKSKSVDRNVIPKNAKASVHLEVSPGDRCKPPSLESTTPVNCTTPINAASPVCMGDEYFKQSCRKNLSRSLLGKELNSLISNGPEPTFTFKDSRRRRDMASVQVLFSHHLDEDIIKQQKKILARLGASVASSISEATHFVADKFVRTKNMLESIAFGKPVVTRLWIESCGQASCFIDERNYIVRDAKKEKEFGFSLPVSLARACQRPLLQGHKVLITPNTKPGKDILANLVRAVHGLAVERIGRSALKGDNIPDDLLVLSCEEDYAICMPFLEKGAAVYTSELLLNGIVTQKLEFERHRLFADHVKKTRSTIWLKRDKNQYLPVSKRK